MSSIEERRDFSDRLQKALKDADYAPDSPTQLSREFNVRFAGRPITVHAARKWLLGEAIPTQEKLRTLAQWLNVPAEWLRFGSERGESSDGTMDRSGSRLEPRDFAVIENLRQLDEKHRNIVQTMIRLLVHASERK